MIGDAFVALARPRGRPYLNKHGPESGGHHHSRRLPGSDGCKMAVPLSTPQQLPGALPPARKLARAVLIGGVGLGVAVLLGALALWFHYGTAIFFEMIASGISACF